MSCDATERLLFGWCEAVVLAVFRWVLLSRGYLSLHARPGICHELHCASMAPPGTEGGDVLHRDRTGFSGCDCADELLNSTDLPAPPSLR